MPVLFHRLAARDFEKKLPDMRAPYFGRMILEEEDKLRIEFRKRSLLGFLSSMHASHSDRGPAELQAKLWAYYNEFSLYAFTFMTLSGVYMWLATRPRMRWAQLTFGASVVTAAALWLAGK